MNISKWCRPPTSHHFFWPWQPKLKYRERWEFLIFFPLKLSLSLFTVKLNVNNSFRFHNWWKFMRLKFTCYVQSRTTSATELIWWKNFDRIRRVKNVWLYKNFSNIWIFSPTPRSAFQSAKTWNLNGKGSLDIVESRKTFLFCSTSQIHS